MRAANNGPCRQEREDCQVAQAASRAALFIRHQKMRPEGRNNASQSVKFPIRKSGKNGIKGAPRGPPERTKWSANLQLILSDAVEGEIFVVDGIEGAAEDSGLHFVMLVRKQLELDVRIAGADVGIAGRQPSAFYHRDVQRALLHVVPAESARIKRKKEIEFQ